MIHVAPSFVLTVNMIQTDKKWYILNLVCRSESAKTFILFDILFLVSSERLDHKKFWGSRQQMLAGKVIADWIDPEGGPLDPIFGVILQPTAGK